jgi:hypothetical protein
MAAGVFSLAAVVLVCAVSVARSPARKVDAEKADPRAALDLVALLRAGEHGSWLARYEFTRTLTNGRALRQPLSEARTGLMHVLVSGAAMTVERNGRVYDCNLVNDRASCHVSTSGRALPASQVLRVAVAAGAYTVSRGPSTTIAGVRALCFLVLGTGRGVLPDIGTRTDACLSPEGVPLSQRVLRPSGDVDERVARAVREGIRASAVEDLARSFGSDSALGQP